jgi:RNA polymerase sigma-70 factor (ECF subfamily)
MALAQLPPEQREVLLFAGAEGLKYEEIAQICGAKIGTIKSRMNRARARLAELLQLQNEDLGPDRVLRAVLSVEGTRRIRPTGASHALTQPF